MTFSECHDKYLAAIMGGSKRFSFPAGSDRDAALLPLSCVPVLAYDNHGLSYPVLIENGVLYLVGAPSGWSLLTLFDRRERSSNAYHGGMWLDMGGSWWCVNFDQVLDEIQSKGLAL